VPPVQSFPVGPREHSDRQVSLIHQSNNIDNADGPRPIRTVGVHSHRPHSEYFASGWTKAHPYGEGHDAGSEASSIYSHRPHSEYFASRWTKAHP